MSRLSPIRELVGHLRAEGLLPEVAQGLDRFLAGECGLEEAFDLREPGSRGRTAQTMAALDHRDRLLREIAQDFLPDLSRLAQAEELCRRWRRYATATAGWSAECALEAPPAWRQGTIEGRLWLVMRAWDEVLGVERLRKVLGTSPPLPMPNDHDDLRS